MSFTSYFLPCAVVFIVCFGMFKKVMVFDCFLDGAKEGAFTSFKILPALVGLMVSVAMLKSSGALDIISYGLSPIAKLLGLPKELIPLAILRPISGSGSLAIFDHTLAEYGSESFIGRIAAVMQGSTETTFYTIAVYYSSIGIKKSRHTLGSALSADLTGFIISVFTVHLIFYS